MYFFFKQDTTRHQFDQYYNNIHLHVTPNFVWWRYFNKITKEFTTFVWVSEKNPMPGEMPARRIIKKE